MSELLRCICWFSCGAASAVAAKLTMEKVKDRELLVVYCDTMATEHPDNERFFQDVEAWLGLNILKLKSKRYEDVDAVFEGRRYMSGIQGAPCTVEMKKRPRFDFQRPTDLHVFGMTLDEKRRADKFAQDNPELGLYWPLIEEQVTKDTCLQILSEAGIKIPAMYELGYKNNNCLGCVKATSPAYWNKIRQDFPEVFQRRCEQSRRFGVKLTRVKGQRIFLDELEPAVVEYVEEDLSCGPQCTGQPAYLD